MNYKNIVYHIIFLFILSFIIVYTISGFMFGRNPITTNEIKTILIQSLFAFVFLIPVLVYVILREIYSDINQKEAKKKARFWSNIFHIVIPAIFFFWLFANAGNMELEALVYLYIIFIATISSFVISFIYAYLAFDINRKLRYIIISCLGILFIFSIIYNASIGQGCGDSTKREANYKCFAKLAYENNDISYCDKLTYKVPYGGFTGWHNYPTKADCYIEYISLKKDISLCDKYDLKIGDNYYMDTMNCKLDVINIIEKDSECITDGTYFKKGGYEFQSKCIDLGNGNKKPEVFECYNNKIVRMFYQKDTC